MGLKKQLATNKAALLREHRKREQAEREVNPIYMYIYIYMYMCIYINVYLTSPSLYIARRLGWG